MQQEREDRKKARNDAMARLHGQQSNLGSRAGLSRGTMGVYTEEEKMAIQSQYENLEDPVNIEQTYGHRDMLSKKYDDDGRPIHGSENRLRRFDKKRRDRDANVNTKEVMDILRAQNRYDLRRKDGFPAIEEFPPIPEIQDSADDKEDEEIRMAFDQFDIAKNSPVQNSYSQNHFSLNSCGLHAAQTYEKSKAEEEVATRFKKQKSKTGVSAVPKKRAVVQDDFLTSRITKCRNNFSDNVDGTNNTALAQIPDTSRITKCRTNFSDNADGTNNTALAQIPETNVEYVNRNKRPSTQEDYRGGHKKKMISDHEHMQPVKCRNGGCSKQSLNQHAESCSRNSRQVRNENENGENDCQFPENSPFCPFEIKKGWKYNCEKKKFKHTNGEEREDFPSVLIKGWIFSRSNEIWEFRPGGSRVAHARQAERPSKLKPGWTKIEAIGGMPAYVNSETQKKTMGTLDEMLPRDAN
jgi:hypothetical protein